MHDKELEKTLANIQDNMRSVTKTDFMLIINWLKNLEDRIEKLEKKRSGFRAITSNFFIEFLMAIIIFFVIYFISKL